MQKLKTITFKQSKMEEFKVKCSKAFLYICILFFAFSIVFNVTYSIAPVSGLSMYPTINENFIKGDETSQDRVVLNYIKSYRRGDVIVAKKSFDDAGEVYMYVIKRLIAIEGDRVRVDANGDVYINDKLLKEDYLNSNKYALYYNIENLKIRKPELFTDGELVIPKDCVFYLGDNRGGSTDCSIFGPVSKDEIVAKADFLIRSGENIFISIIKQIFGGKRI